MFFYAVLTLSGIGCQKGNRSSFYFIQIFITNVDTKRILLSTEFWKREIYESQKNNCISVCYYLQISCTLLALLLFLVHHREYCVMWLFLFLFEKM